MNDTTAPDTDAAEALPMGTALPQPRALISLPGLPPESNPVDVVRLFQPHGPGWMLVSLLVERLPRLVAYSAVLVVALLSAYWRFKV